MNFAMKALIALSLEVSAILALGDIITTRSELSTARHALLEQFPQEIEEHGCAFLAKLAPTIPLPVKASVTSAL